MRIQYALSLALLAALPLASHAADRRGDLRVELADNWDADNVFTGDSGETNALWWRKFNDPLLDSLITVGRENNYSVSAAIRRIEVAKAQLTQARSAYYPSIDLSAGYTRERTSGRMVSSSGSASTMSYFNGGATLSWEIDVFGKVRQQTKRAGAAVKVSAAEYAGVMTAIEANIAKTYVNLIVERLQLQVANEHGANQAHLVEMVETRYRTGLASKLELAQAKTLYYSTIAPVPQLEASIQASLNALAVLLGVTPDQLPPELAQVNLMPTATGNVALGAPVDLLRRRPDVVEAERNIDVAAAELGIARSAYLPSLSLNAAVGTQAHRFGDLFSGPSFTYSVAPTLSWTLFDGMQRRGATVAAQQSLEAAVDNYNLTVLTALEDVRNSIASYTADQEYISRIEEVVTNAEEEVRLSVDLYKQGLTVFSNVVDAQLNYLTYQNTLVAARGEALTSLITLFEALGGGWEQ